MKAVIAIDSLKGSLTSIEAGKAAEEGIKRVYPAAETVVLPLADGGEGTAQALAYGIGGVMKEVTVTDPLGRKINASYGIIQSTNTAIIEMSAAAGITLISENEKNPFNTTTYGVGEMIKDAIKEGCREFIVGIGGSATNDGGVGMLQALGFGVLDENGKQVAFGAKGLKDIRSITDMDVISELRECRFNIACDVTNPLCGENGCSAVYGPQKGATADMIDKMDKWLFDFASTTKKYIPKADLNYPGTGAAGGMGFAFLSYMNASLESGIDLILKEIHIEDHIRNSDVVITGEGRLDFQSAMGKAPVGVAELAKKHGIPVIAFAGSVDKAAVECNKKGIDAFFPILRSVCSLEEAMNPDNARTNMADTAEQVFRAIKTFES